MVLKNTKRNCAIVRRAYRIAKEHPGFTPLVIPWNVDRDIVFCVACDKFAFDIDYKDGELNVKVRGIPDCRDLWDVVQLKHRFEALDDLMCKLDKLVKERKPDA